MRTNKPAGPVETFIALGVCVTIAALVTNAFINDSKKPSPENIPVSTTTLPPLTENDPSVTVESCKKITDYNFRACVDFANWCHKWGENVEKGILYSTDESIRNCEKKGWKYDTRNW